MVAIRTDTVVLERRWIEARQYLSHKGDFKND